MVDPLDNLTSSDQLRRLLLQEEQERIDRLEARLGDDRALTKSIVPVIADILRDAGVTDHRRLADALAPVVVQSIKTEIRNSRDMMVDALYPITGRLVAAAVRNAFKDLVDQLNAKLDSTFSADRWRTRIKATISGRSEAEVLLSEGVAFEIVDLLLIDRQSGLLIAQAEPHPNEGGMDSHLLSSILTAIMAFVRDAMSNSREQDLRTLHVGDLRLHLQVSPCAILAIKTRGPPPAAFDTALSETYHGFLSRWGGVLSDPNQISDHDGETLNLDLKERFQSLLKAKRTNFRGPSRKGTMLLGALFSAAFLWVGWTIYEKWSASYIETKARAIIKEQKELTGYPIDVHHDSRGTLIVAGLLPNENVVDRLRNDLRTALTDVDFSFDLASLPEQDVDLTSFVRAEDLHAWHQSVGENVLQTLDDRISPLTETMSAFERRLSTSAGSEHAAFRSWLERQSVKFTDDSKVDDETALSSTLEEIVSRLSNMNDHLGLRVVGYGDDLGEEQVSDRVSRARAVLVANRLRRLGVSADRLQVVGRGKEKRISDVDGPDSLNRRVEFELTFPQSQ